MNRYMESEVVREFERKLVALMRKNEPNGGALSLIAWMSRNLQESDLLILERAEKELGEEGSRIWLDALIRSAFPQTTTAVA